MLTNHQQEVLTAGLRLLTFNKRLLIKGSAGTGKTYLVDSLLNSKFFSNKKSKLCTAPTNKAVAVLKGKIVDQPNRVLKTTHAALALRMKINNRTGEVYFSPNKHALKHLKLQYFDVLVVDEASMVNTPLLEHIENVAKEYNLYVVFLGDEKQLNPVGEEDSPVFKAGYPTVELTEIIRQKEESPIIGLSNNLGLIYNKTPKLINNLGYLYSHNLKYENPEGRIIEKLAEANGSNDIKYLAYTNKEVNRINSLVRERIYKSPKKVELEESLIFNSPYLDYYTNQEVTIFNVTELKKNFYVPNIGDKLFKHYLVNGDIKIIHEDSEKEFVEVCRKLWKAAKDRKISFRDYYSFLENFADIKYNHAITVHKSQGSTYGQTVLNVKDIMKSRTTKERKRLLYTGITRASDILLLHNI